MSRKSVITVTLVLIAAIKLSAQSGPSTFEFVENKGQWDSRVRFKGELPSGDFYLHQNGFTVVQYHTEDLFKFFRSHHGHTYNESSKKNGKKINRRTGIDVAHPLPEGPSSGDNIRAHAYYVQFLNANTKAEIIPDKAITSISNFIIGNDPSRWASQVRSFQAVTYRNIYPNIDVRYYSENGTIKYDLIVKPGGQVNNILMRYEGADKLDLKNGDLIIKTSVGDLKELYPYSYQVDPASGRKEVSCSYDLVDKNTVRFKVTNYSKTTTLVIDPTLIFCSFTGSRAPQWGFTATPGPDGSVYSGGIVFGSNFPVSTGAFEEDFQGGAKDIGIFKFSSNGRQRVYATYLGGRANEYPHSLICDPQGNLVVMGRSYSDNYPGTKVGPTGGGDIVVTKLNASGSNYIGSLIIGGSAQDGVNVDDQQEGASLRTNSTLRFYGDDSRSEVTLDNAGNIYVAAQTRSGNFPVTPGVFQGASGGAQDGAVIKINPSCTSVIWASYIGGSTDDGAFVICVNPTNNDIYVGGATTSTNFPGNKTGSYQGSYQGGNTDAFLARIANNGTAIIKSSYLGTPNFDAIYGIQFDRNGMPYIMGTSEGAWPVRNATFSNPGSRQFISKVEPDLSDLIYSTVFGSGSPRPNISPVAFLVDRCENVYVSGWGGWIAPTGTDSYGMSGTAGMPTSPDAIKSTTDNRDMYFIVIRKDASSLLYGTFFGQSGGEGEHVDGGTSRYDQQGVIYQAICANCYGSVPAPITVPFPTTPGVWGPSNGTGDDDCNLAVVKLAFNFAGVASGPKAFIGGVEDTVGCVPFTVTFRDTVRNARSYIWDFGDGSPEETTDSFEIAHTYSAIGTYRIRLIAIDSTSCNIRDTAYITVHARDDMATLAFTATKMDPCESLTYLFENNSVAPPGEPFTSNSFIWDFGDGTRIPSGPGDVTHSYAGPNAYQVKLILADTSYCNSPDSMVLNLNVSALVDARFETPANGCAPYNAVFNNTSMGGQQYSWDFGDGTTSTEMSPVHLYPVTGTYTVKLIVIDSNTCNIIDSVSTSITVNPLPTADFNTAPVPALENTPTTFFNLSTGGVRYKWLFGDGDSTIKTTMDTTMHQYNATGIYEACLITYNEFECTDTVCKPVQAVISPLLDVPNAFTPGRGGQNATIRVAGFGIGRMIWRIYNRWGQVVFETNNRKMGWDGTYKGQPQPMAVYAYTLDVEFTDGTRIRKTGDITLIR